jgi:hypothetical protein
MLLSEFIGLLGTAFCFALAFAYIKACDLLKRGRSE